MSFSDNTRRKLSEMLGPGNYTPFTSRVIKEIPKIAVLPILETNRTLPYLNNHFFGILDAAALSAAIQMYKPATIIEIGSGISTRFMRYFINQYQLGSTIVAIDPFPRAEISDVADKIFRTSLEETPDNIFSALQANDILFMDGSHYVFQGNDTLTFFFRLLPDLAPGVIIHIHDVYLPSDYEDNVAPQLWSEQYILAAMLLSGFEGYEVVYPAYHSYKTDPAIQTALQKTIPVQQELNLRPDPAAGYSFWMKKI